MVKFMRLLLAIVAVLVVCGCRSQSARSFDSLVIRGTPQFGQQVESALQMLREKSPEGYATVTNYVGVIRQGKHSGMRAEENPPVFDLNDRSAYHSVTWCAGVIAHDSFHSKLYNDHRKTNGSTVPREIWVGHEAEKKCLAHQEKVLKELGAPAAEIDYCSTLSPDYSDVPYGKRDW
jgi:hypothetical protein